MATTRRVFLEVIGVGAAGATLNSACMGFVEDGGLPRGTGGTGAGGQTGGGQTGVGGSGLGGSGVGGSGPDGAGGSIAGAGGSIDPGTGGRTGVAMDASAPRDVGGTDAPRDTGTPPRDGGIVLQPGDLTAGNTSGLAVGALNAIPGSTVAIGRDAMGLYAMTLVCTHQGCTAAPAGATGARQVNCPCHGSQFDRNGAVIRGPAARPLVHFSVTVDAGGNIVVHSTMQVAATVRTVV